MANLATNQDIVLDALFNCGEIASLSTAPSTSDYYDQAIAFINKLYQQICTGACPLDPDIQQDWWWLRKSSPGVISLLPSITKATTTLTKNSTAVVLASAPTQFAANVDLTGWFAIPQNSNGDVFRVSSHTSGSTNLTLDGVFTNATGSYTVKFVKLQYTLASDFSGAIGPMRVFQAGKNEVPGCELDKMLDDFPLREVQSGVPEKFALVAEQIVQFSHYAGDNDELIRIEYDYRVIPSDLAYDTGAPLIPKPYRSILSEGAAGYICSIKGDSRASDLLASAKASYQGMDLAHRSRMSNQADNFGKIQPRRDQSRARSVPRTASGLILGA